MKIYFEDGKLHKYDGTLPFDRNYFELSADDGPSENLKMLDFYKQLKPGYTLVIYTNSIFALNNEYAWDNELKVPEIYLRTGFNIFTRIDQLTSRELREGHNIAHMYIAGEFEEYMEKFKE